MSSARRAYDLLRSYVGQEWERIQSSDLFAAREELAGPVAAASADTVPQPVKTPVDQETRARTILGVPETATFEEVRKAFERLHKRSDPTRFQEGTAEFETAQHLHRQVNLAYKILEAKFDPAARRFGSLEFE